jgi:hypothetical protein
MAGSTSRLIPPRFDPNESSAVKLSPAQIAVFRRLQWTPVTLEDSNVALLSPKKVHGAFMSTLQVKLAWLDGSRSQLKSFVERGGDLESEQAITLRSVFRHSFVELTLELGGGHLLNGCPSTGSPALPALDAEYPVSP